MIFRNFFSQVRCQGDVSIVELRVRVLVRVQDLIVCRRHLQLMLVWRFSVSEEKNRGNVEFKIKVRHLWRKNGFRILWRNDARTLKNSKIELITIILYLLIKPTKYEFTSCNLGGIDLKLTLKKNFHFWNNLFSYNL